MLRLLLTRGKRRSKRDYTKDSSIGWFIVLLLILAGYVILRTVINSHATDTRDADKRSGSEQKHTPIASSLFAAAA